MLNNCIVKVCIILSDLRKNSLFIDLASSLKTAITPAYKTDT